MSAASLLGRVRRAVVPDLDEDVVYECRNCGTDASRGVVSCSSCGASDIARYRVS